MSDEIKKDLILGWSDHVAGQSSDLWTVSLALLVAQVLVLATLHASPSRCSRILLLGTYLSAMLSFFSLAFGYFVKGSVITGIAQTLESGKLELPAYPALNALLQVVLLVVALLIFLGLFGFFRREVSRALLGVIRGE